MTDLAALPTRRSTGPRPPRGPGSRGVDDRAGASAGATVRCSSPSGGRGRRYAAQPRYDPGCVRRTAAPGSHRRYGMTTQDQGRAEFDSSVPHPARIYDYLLGGKDNYPADRAAAEATLAVGPEGRAIARANRRFLVRAVRFLAEQGIRQFIDIGTGIPTSPNVHEVAQAVAPGARVVYVDNDPLVLAHARALLRSHGPGETRFLHADLRDPEAILGDPDLRALIDFAQPLAVLLVATLHHIPDADDPAGIVTRLLAPAGSGSYLVVSQLASDLKPERAAGVAAAAKRSGVTLLPRRRDQVLRFFAGLDLVEPGLVQPPLWRPDPGRDPSEEEENLDLVWFYAGVARKP